MGKKVKFILITIPILFIIGSLFHFLYDLSDNNIFIGIIAPVNESVWEHTKMILFPYLLYFSIYYLIYKDKLNLNKWSFSLLISIIVGILIIPLLYYTYTEAFGIDLVIIDILILLVANIVSTLLFVHIYEYKKNTIFFIASLLVILIIVFIYTIFTFNPPYLPIFVDPSTGYLGI